MQAHRHPLRGARCEARKLELGPTNNNSTYYGDISSLSVRGSGHLAGPLSTVSYCVLL